MVIMSDPTIRKWLGSWDVGSNASVRPLHLADARYLSFSPVSYRIRCNSYEHQHCKETLWKTGRRSVCKVIGTLLASGYPRSIPHTQVIQIVHKKSVVNVPNFVSGFPGIDLNNEGRAQNGIDTEREWLFCVEDPTQRRRLTIESQEPSTAECWTLLTLLSFCCTAGSNSTGSFTHTPRPLDLLNPSLAPHLHCGIPRSDKKENGDNPEGFANSILLFNLWFWGCLQVIPRSFSVGSLIRFLSCFVWALIHLSRI